MKLKNEIDFIDEFYIYPEKQNELNFYINPLNL